VIGAHQATTRIPHGAHVEVDPAHGTVRPLLLGDAIVARSQSRLAPHKCAHAPSSVMLARSCAQRRASLFGRSRPLGRRRRPDPESTRQAGRRSSTPTGVDARPVPFARGPAPCACVRRAGSRKRRRITGLAASGIAG
jgi:hypothetical protein